MPVTAQLKLDDTKLLYQQNTGLEAELQNNTRAVLSNVNPGSQAHGPSILATDVATGVVTAHRLLRPAGAAEQPLDLAPNKKRVAEFMFTELVKLPGPGTYDLRARYEWDGGAGAVESPPVRVEILPSNPQCAHVVTAQGGAAPLYYAAWVNRNAADKGKLELWLSEIMTTGRPTIIQCTRLDDLKAPVEPVLSVPPNTSPHAQWVAWVQGNQLNYLVHQSEAASKTRTTPLPTADCRIVPPLFQTAMQRDRVIPGATVLLYERATGATEGRFIVTVLSATHEVRTDPPVAVPGPAPLWMQSAYLVDASRYTFWIVRDPGVSVLWVSSWRNLRPPSPPKQLGAWPGNCLAADLWLTEENVVVGAVLLQAGDGKLRKYTLRTWSFRNGGFVDGREVPVTLPKPSIGVEQAVVSVSADGLPYALMQTDLPNRPWFYCGADGTAMPLPLETTGFQPPVKVLFRRTTDPTILFTLPGRGFQFARPG